MLYHKHQRQSARTYLLAVCTILFLNEDKLLIKSLLLVGALFVMRLLCIRTTTELRSDCIYYEMRLCGRRVLHRTLKPAQIEVVKFDRLNWLDKQAKIIPKNGLSIRIAHYLPSDILQELERFCRQHQVASNKTKDYEMLERRHKRINDEKHAL